jgi:hypothetical protein
MQSPQLRLLPAPSPADLWIAALRGDLAPSTLTFLMRPSRTGVSGGSAPTSVDAWIAAVRREQAA